ncbi:MAG: hypothetical protein GX316_02380 [Firmicutes bacterium]|nr:hypothetical protein [Bacillota bacterium]
MQSCQAERAKLQKRAIKALREQRHEVLNDLATISSYMQMGMVAAAQQAINYLSVRLADEYNYSDLPDQAWLSMLSCKQEEAFFLGIDLQIHEETGYPTDLYEQRLLPKLAALLLDNAFDAAGRESAPKVKFTWKRTANGRLLTVEDNRSKASRAKLMEAFGNNCVNCLDESDGDWGLPLCRQIATELGGTLSVETCSNHTKFSFMLADKHQSGLSEAAATIE